MCFLYFRFFFRDGTAGAASASWLSSFIFLFLCFCRQLSPVLQELACRHACFSAYLSDVRQLHILPYKTVDVSVLGGLYAVRLQPIVEVAVQSEGECL